MLKLDAGQADDGSMDIIGWMLIGVDIFVFVSFFICLMLAVWHVRLQIKKISKVKRRIRALASAVSSNRHMSFMVASNATGGSDETSTGLRSWKVSGAVGAEPGDQAKSTKVVPTEGVGDEHKEHLQKLNEIEQKFGKDSDEYAAQQDLVLQAALFGSHS